MAARYNTDDKVREALARAEAHGINTSCTQPDEIKGPYTECPGYGCADPEETAAFMQSVRKPG